MDGCVRIRPGARIWVLLPPAADAAICWIPFVDLPPLFQRGRRAWSDSHARPVHSCTGNPVPVRCSGTHRDDNTVGLGGAHGLALDDRARHGFEPVSISMAGTE